MASSTIAYVLLLVIGSTAQNIGGTKKQRTPWRFQDYPARVGFKGKPAKPILVTAREHSYRTEIRYQARKGPDFAGHFTVAEWGCGSPCLYFVIINATSGAIYDPGIVVGCVNEYRMDAEVHFQLESRLIAVTGVLKTPSSSDEVVCGTNYYQWDGKRLSLIHFEPWPKSGP